MHRVQTGWKGCPGTEMVRKISVETIIMQMLQIEVKIRAEPNSILS